MLRANRNTLRWCALHLHLRYLQKCISQYPLKSNMEKIEKIEDVSVVSCTDSKYVQPFRVAYKQDGHQKYWDCVMMHDSVATLIFNKTRNAFVLVRQFRPAVYMAQHRHLWEHSSVFTSSLSEQPSSDQRNPQVSEGEPQLCSGTNPGTPSGREVEACDSQSGASLPREYSHGSLGCTYELCAGLVDKKVSLAQTAKEEILEETGYDVPVDSMEYVTSYYSSMGTGSRQTVFYCEVTDGMLEADGGGNRHEGEMIDVYHLPIAEADEFIFDTSKPKSTGICFSFLWFDKFKKPHLKSQ